MGNSKLQAKPGIEKYYKVLTGYLSQEPGT